jgi:hypothetical protein
MTKDPIPTVAWQHCDGFPSFISDDHKRGSHADLMPTLNVPLVRRADAERLIANLQAEVVKLRAFAVDVMEAWPEGDLDGDTLQSAAIEHGLLERKSPDPTEPCGEGCLCAQYVDMDEWAVGIECYRRTPLLSAAPTLPKEAP